MSPGRLQILLQINSELISAHASFKENSAVPARLAHGPHERHSNAPRAYFALTTETGVVRRGRECGRTDSAASCSRKETTVRLLVLRLCRSAASFTSCDAARDSAATSASRTAASDSACSHNRARSGPADSSAAASSAHSRRTTAACICCVCVLFEGLDDSRCASSSTRLIWRRSSSSALLASTTASSSSDMALSSLGSNLAPFCIRRENPLESTSPWVPKASDCDDDRVGVSLNAPYSRCRRHAALPV
eukprot:2082904-Pleurochrysis_carterae.AAC.2